MPKFWVKLNVYKVDDIGMIRETLCEINTLITDEKEIDVIKGAVKKLEHDWKSTAKETIEKIEKYLGDKP